MSKSFCKLYTRMKFPCCGRGLAKQEKDELLANKFINFKACRLIIGEKLNLENYLHDAMDFHAVRQLMVKSRHKILMPTLVLHLTKTKLNQGEYRSSSGRHLYERTDLPVFTIEEAVSQLKTNDPKRTVIEKAMDDFFMTHLPEKVISLAGDHQHNELDENAIRPQKKSRVPTKKNRVRAQLGNDLQAFIRTPSPSSFYSNVRNKKRKSDLTLAFISKPSSPRQREILTPDSLKKTCSQQLSRDLAVMKRIEPIVAERLAEQIPSID